MTIEKVIEIHDQLISERMKEAGILKNDIAETELVRFHVEFKRRLFVAMKPTEATQ